MRFEKYHSTGNDFLLTIGPIDEISQVAKDVCDRRFGIGADGILVAYPSMKNDIRMVYYNSDGTEAPMCGNGLRAFAHFVFHQGLIDQKDFVVETLAGPMQVHLLNEDFISIHLGKPQFNLSQPHVKASMKTDEPVQISIDTVDYQVHALFLGTLHGVVFVDHYSNGLVERIGDLLCHHPLFPQNININFVRIIDPSNIEVRTYERGVGPTLSCGTGVSSSAVVAHIYKGLSSILDVKVPGGTLKVEVTTDDVILTGPTKWVATVDLRK